MIPTHAEIIPEEQKYYSECCQCHRPKSSSPHRICPICETIMNHALSYKLAGAIACQIGCPVPWGQEVVWK